MDTRHKIVACDEVPAIAARQPALAVVTGCFDVLQGAHVRHLEEVRRKARPSALLVVLTPGRDPILAPRARAEMVAALAMVDYVVIADKSGPGLDAWLAGLGAPTTVRAEGEHEGQLTRLIEHVRRRHEDI